MSQCRKCYFRCKLEAVEGIEQPSKENFVINEETNSDSEDHSDFGLNDINHDIKVQIYDETENINLNNGKSDFHCNLAKWAVKYQSNYDALNSLLHLLRNNFDSKKAKHSSRYDLRANAGSI